MKIRVKNDEVWRDIENYEGLYQISNFGRVKSLHYEREKILKLSNAKDGYLQITLQNKGGKSFQIHRLVANAFIPNPNNFSQVNHIDENKKNNKAKNLEWCTPLYNIRYGNGIKKRAINRGTSVIGVDEEGSEVQFYSLTEAGRNGFDSSAVLKCCKGIRNHHKGHSWKFTKKTEDNYEN